MLTVYIGVRSAKEIPLADEVAGWAHAGVRLVLCRSRAAEDDLGLLPEAVRAEGYVQRVIQADIASGRLGSDLVFAAGPAEMLETLRGLATATLEVVTNA